MLSAVNLLFIVSSDYRSSAASVILISCTKGGIHKNNGTAVWVLFSVYVLKKKDVQCDSFQICSNTKQMLKSANVFT